MTFIRRSRQLAIFGAMLAFILTACVSPAQNESATSTVEPVTSDAEGEIEIHVEYERAPDVPDLPFDDNPDPTQCGIPVQWGKDDPAWLTGIYQGELIQPKVLLYDSHLRQSIEASAPHGSEVQVILFQRNPTLDYYMVRIVGQDPPNEGWVPAPFLSFEPLQ